jgi:hypothetical protein
MATKRCARCGSDDFVGFYRVSKDRWHCTRCGAFTAGGASMSTMERAIYYGPPGSGKTTRVREEKGFDLEDVAPQDRLAFLLQCMTRERFPIGAADTHPDDAKRIANSLGIRVETVLLLPPRDLYDARRRERDARQPEKAKQADVYDNFQRNEASFDRVDRT